MAQKQLMSLGNDKSKFYEKALKQALNFCAKSVIPRPSLSGVYHRGDGALVATDGMRLIIIENAHERSNGVIINKKGEDVQAVYPDVSKIVNLCNQSIDVENINVQEWLDAMEGLLALAEKKSKGIYVSGKIRNGAPVELSAENPEVGNGKWEMKEKGSTYRNSELDIVFQGLYMRDALKAIKALGCKKASIHFDDSARKPFIIKFEHGLCLIAPILPKK